MDVAIVWDSANARGDWDVSGDDLALGPDIESAVLVSLFTDRRASDDYVFPDRNAIPDRRGHWTDTYEPFLIGSRLWQLNRSKKTDATTLLAQAQDMCIEALQWLIDAGVVARIDVTTFWASPVAIGIFIDVWKPGASAAVRFEYQWAWDGL
jgi:phage gp46-like protein